MIGSWGGIELLVDPYKQAHNGTIRVLIYVHIDVGVAHDESFAVVKDIVTA